MKRILFLALAFLFLSPSPARADCPGMAVHPSLTPLGYQQLTVSATAVGFTLPAGVTVLMAVAMVETNTIRYRDDGVNPTASVGTLVQANVPVVVCGAAISSFRAIRTGSDAALSINFYGN